MFRRIEEDKEKNKDEVKTERRSSFVSFDRPKGSVVGSNADEMAESRESGFVQHQVNNNRRETEDEMGFDNESNNNDPDQDTSKSKHLDI